MMFVDRMIPSTTEMPTPYRFSTIRFAIVSFMIIVGKSKSGSSSRRRVAPVVVSSVAPIIELLSV